MRPGYQEEPQSGGCVCLRHWVESQGPGRISGGLLITPLLGERGGGRKWQMDPLTSLIKVQWSRAPWEPFWLTIESPPGRIASGTVGTKGAWIWKYSLESTPSRRGAPLTCIPTPQNMHTLPRATPTSLGSETQSSWPSIWGSSVALESKNRPLRGRPGIRSALSPLPLLFPLLPCHACTDCRPKATAKSPVTLHRSNATALAVTPLI